MSSTQKSGWTADELPAIDGTGEVEVQGELIAGRLRRDVSFVEIGEHTGDSSDVDDALDAAYRDKYGRGPAVAHIAADIARATTLRIDPA